FVWSYFQEEDGNDVCKILISIRGKETTCGKRYKHDCSTGNMKQHLQVKHGILESEELQTGLEKYSQPKIDSIFKKVIPHDSSKQKELKRITAVWLITDSLPFNVVNKKGYLKIMKTIDPAFNSPSSKSIKNSLSVAYNKGMEENNESENVDMELKVLHTKVKLCFGYINYTRNGSKNMKHSWYSVACQVISEVDGMDDTVEIEVKDVTVEVDDGSFKACEVDLGIVAANRAD
ncbi:23893_t:CDS:2, partial [Entrophospora sp. SA101]